VPPGKTDSEGGDSMAAKGEDLVKFITEQVVTYIETPKDARKHARQRTKEHRENWQIHWFGLFPLAIRMWRDQVRRNKGTPPKG
jgi:hypothetical protein